MGDGHENMQFFFSSHGGAQKLPRAVLPASKLSGYCTTIICPSFTAVQGLLGIMRTWARVVRRAWPSVSGGPPLISENCMNSWPSPITDDRLLLQTLGIPYHDPLPLPDNGAAPFPDHADRAAPRALCRAHDHPPRVAVGEWRSTSHLGELHEFMTVPYYGFILGPMLEENLRRALVLSRGDFTVFFRRPISLAMLLMAAVLLILIVVPNIRKKREEVFVEGG